MELLGGVPLTECAARLDHTWDARGGFVCGLDAGHGGMHVSRKAKNRATVSWVDDEER